MAGLVNLPANTNSEGVVVLNGAGPSVLVNGKPIATMANSTVTPHSHGNTTIPSSFTTGSGTVIANGSPVLRLGERAVCGHSITTSSPNVNAT